MCRKLEEAEERYAAGFLMSENSTQQMDVDCELSDEPMEIQSSVTEETNDSQIQQDLQQRKTHISNPESFERG